MRRSANPDATVDIARYPAPLSLDELLGIPQVVQVISDSRGRIAWTERSDGHCNAFVAEAPTYVAHRLTQYEDDDGQPLSLIGFGADWLVAQRGAPGGFNPAQSPDPPQPAVLRIDLNSAVATQLPVAVDGGAMGLASDGRTLFLARGEDVWAVPLDEPARESRLFQTRGRITGFLPSPDGSKLAFLSDRSIYDRGKYAFVGVYDLAGRRLTYMQPGLGLDQSPTWSPDSRRVAFIRFGLEPRTWRFSDHREGAPFSVVVADAETGRGEAVFTSELGYGCRFNGFEPEGYFGTGGRNNLSWLSDDSLVFPYEKTGWKLLYAVPASGGAARLLTPGAFEIDGVAISLDRARLVYWANSERDPHRLDLYELTLEDGLTPKAIGPPAGDDIRRDALFVAPGVLAYIHAGAQAPERLVVEAEAGRPAQLSTGPAPGDVVARKGRPAEIVTFKADDGLEIPAILYRPAGAPPAERLPLIVHAHGGSRYKLYPVWTSSFTMTAVAHYFLQRGFLVLSVNYRSGTGYGLNFREPESYGGRGAGDVDDIIAAARYAKANIPGVDPDRVAVYGHSYGGFLVSGAVARSQEFAAAVNSAGVGDWVVEMEKDFGEPLQFNIPQRVELEGLAYRSSAIAHVDDWGDTPMLFLHGDHDSQGAMQQPLELYLALQRRGKAVEALVLEGEEHGIFLRRNRVAYLQTIEAFLARHLGARVPGSRSPRPPSER